MTQPPLVQRVALVFGLVCLLIALAGCVTPPLHDLQVAQAACAQGNQDACADIPRLQAVRQAYNAKVAHDIGVTAANLALIGAVVAPIVIVAGAPHPHPPPVPPGHP